jgi:hypothetical protein
VPWRQDVVQRLGSSRAAWLGGKGRISSALGINVEFVSPIGIEPAGVRLRSSLRDYSCVVA